METKNNIIDFAKVRGEESVAKTAAVDSTTVNELFNAFIKIPTSVVVKFQNVKGYLYMIAEMTFEGKDKYGYKYQTYADFNLVEKMLCSMSNPKMVGCLGGYKVEEHPLEVSEVDPRIDLFRQFINSRLRCYFDSDFVSSKGDRYVCVTFHIGFRKEVKFCLKRTEEIETVINDAIKAAV